MNYTFIVLGIVLVVVLFILYKVFTEKKTKLETDRKLSVNSHKYEDLKNPVSPNFYIAIWLYVHSLNTDGNNVIYQIKDDSDVLKFKLDITGNGALQYDNSGNIVIMDNFPLQKWTHVIINVTSGNLIDSYVDGKLMKSQEVESGKEFKTTYQYKLLEGNAASSTANANVAGFERVPQAITPKEAWDKYLAGNGGNMFTRFFQTWGLSLVLTKDNEDQKSISFPPNFS